MPANLILFPGVRAEHVLPAATPPTPTVRFGRWQPRWKQRRLALTPHADTLGERIAAAEKMVGYYEDKAALERDRELKARYLGRAAKWRADAAALAGERDAVTAQQKLL